MDKKRKIIALLLLLFGFLLYSSAYIVNEGEQIVVFQFGNPVVTRENPGLYFKLPFVQDVKKFEKRILDWDGDPTVIPLAGDMFISVDTYARWKIENPEAFYRSLTEESAAQSRLDDVINGVIKDLVPKNELSEIIKNGNDWCDEEEPFVDNNNNGEWDEGESFDDINKNGKWNRAESFIDSNGNGKWDPAEGFNDSNENNELDKGEEFEDLNGNGKWDPAEEFDDSNVNGGRLLLVQLIIDGVQEKIKEEGWGIEILDVQIKRVNYSPSVQPNVFAKIKERQGVTAASLRSLGLEEAIVIRSEMKKDTLSILSEGESLSKMIRSSGNAQGIEMFLQAQLEYPKYFAFKDNLENLRKTLNSKISVILSTDNPYLETIQYPPYKD